MAESGEVTDPTVLPRGEVCRVKLTDGCWRSGEVWVVQDTDGQPLWVALRSDGLNSSYSSWIPWRSVRIIDVL